jgi:hypothetical protein
MGKLDAMLETPTHAATVIVFFVVACVTSFRPTMQAA